MVFSVVTRFKVVDEEYLRRHPQAGHAEYEERLKETAKRAARFDEYARELSTPLMGENVRTS